MMKNDKVKIDTITNFAKVIELSKGTIFENCPWKLVRLKSKLADEYDRLTSLEAFIDLVLLKSSLTENEPNELCVTIADQKYEIFYAMAILEDIPLFKNSIVFEKSSNFPYKIISKSLIDDNKLLVERIESGKTVIDLLYLFEVTAYKNEKM